MLLGLSFHLQACKVSMALTGTYSHTLHDLCAANEFLCLIVPFFSRLYKQYLEHGNAPSIQKESCPMGSELYTQL